MIEKLLYFFVKLHSRWINREALKVLGAKRSSDWPRIRRNHLEIEPVCAVCKKSDELSVHHKLPFSRYPHLELAESNLITLCEAPGREHHLNYGHLGSYMSYNQNVDEDCEIWAEKIKSRP